jgi:hypothetical protein
MTNYVPSQINQPSIYAGGQQQQQQQQPMQGLGNLKQGDGMLSQYWQGTSGVPIDQAAANSTGTITPAGGGGESWMASAGPWAALAAAIMWNEDNAREHGRRPEDRGEWAQDAFSGKVLEADAEHYADKVGGIGGEMIEVGGRLGNPEGFVQQNKEWADQSLDFTKDSVQKPLQWLGGLFS